MRKHYNIDIHNLKPLDYPFLAYFILRTKGKKALLKSLTAGVLRNLDKENKNVLHEPTLQAKFHSVDRFKILFVTTGDYASASSRYRVYNIAEYLNLDPDRQVEYEIVKIEDLDLRADTLHLYNIIYFSRIVNNPVVEEVISRCKQNNLITVFEVDDLVFEEGLVGYVDAIKDWPQEKKDIYISDVKKSLSVLSQCDYFIAPTKYLTQHVANKYGTTSFLLRNALNQVQVSKAKEVSEEQINLGRDKDEIRIGYFSGTKTHQKDFLEAKDALLELLKKYKTLKFFYMGYLDLSEEFDQFKDQIKHIEFKPWQEHLAEVATVDINIAPLEIGNPYCESKSEVKYIEASILKIPTVASSTGSFNDVIKNGENGFTCGSKEDWLKSLESLITDKELRKRIGSAAFRDVLKEYSPEVMSRKVVKTFRDIVRDYRVKRQGLMDESLIINWIITAPVKGAGGHRNIFRACKYLYDFGCRCRIYCLNDGAFKSDQALKNFVTEHFFETHATYHILRNEVDYADITFATHWSTVDAVVKNRNKNNDLFYFIQDYEPYFYSMGEEYVQAEMTYKMGLKSVTSGPWCGALLNKNFNVDSDFFDLPVDKNIYYERPYVKREKKVIFFARPEMPRRCYNIGLKALEILKEKDPSIEIVLYGSSLVDSKKIPFEHKNLGMLNINQLAELYSSGIVGIAFSTTNPSLVPYEMMASGLIAVDLDYNNNELNYGGRENILLVAPDPLAIANSIHDLINNEAELDKLRANSKKYIDNKPNELECMQKLYKIIRRMYVKT